MYNNSIKMLARWMTSPSFVAVFFGLIGFWITFNIFSPWKFDAPPFMALNLVMSALAGVQATVVAVAQKEKELQDEKQERYMLHLMEAITQLMKMKIDEKKEAAASDEDKKN